MSLLSVGLSATTIEPALTGGRVDGIGVYTTALLNGLAEAQCDVKAFAYPPLRNRSLGREFLLSIPMPQPFVVTALRDLVQPNSTLGRFPVDVFHVTDYRVAKMNVPVVATLHDAIPQKYPQWSNPRLRTLKNWLQRKAVGRADHVIALSQFAIAELVECFGINENKITVVPCGVDSSWSVPPNSVQVEETLRLYGLRRGYFMFVGTFQPRKNIERIIEAYLGLPDKIRHERQLLLVGRSGWQSEKTIAMIAAAKQKGENVIWLSDLGSNTQLRHLYDGAGVFVFPSLYEGFGIPVAEAFAAGVPVVTSNTTSLPEVSGGAALEINPLSVEEIRDAMNALLQDDALRLQCIHAGSSRAAQLTWQRTVRETRAVYSRVLSR